MRSCARHAPPKCVIDGACRGKIFLDRPRAHRSRDVQSDSLLNVHERECRVRFDHSDDEARRRLGKRSDTVMHLLLLRSLFREMISDLAGPTPTAEELNEAA